VEGLVHVSEFGARSPCDPSTLVREGERLHLRVIRLDPSQRKLGLSLRAVAEGAQADTRISPTTA